MEEEMLNRGEPILQNKVFPFDYFTLSPSHSLKK
jgi:hypothetical protein